MPTFDFECSDCNEVFEFNRSFGSSEHPACPKCKSTNTQKLMHTPNIVFKGSGFYKTDSSSTTTTTKKEVTPAKETPKPEPVKKAEVPKKN